VDPDLPEVSALCASALFMQSSSLVLPLILISIYKAPVARLIVISPYLDEEKRVLDKPYKIKWAVRAEKELR
jgi:hypothetical protein